MQVPNLDHDVSWQHSKLRDRFLQPSCFIHCSCLWILATNLFREEVLGVTSQNPGVYAASVPHLSIYPYPYDHNNHSHPKKATLEIPFPLPSRLNPPTPQPLFLPHNPHRI
jgi:hypothetical protein